MGFVLTLILVILVLFYDSDQEEKFRERDVDWGKCSAFIA